MILFVRGSKINDFVCHGKQIQWLCLRGQANSMILRASASKVNDFACQGKHIQLLCLQGQTNSMILLARASKVNDFACQGRQTQLRCFEITGFLWITMNIEINGTIWSSTRLYGYPWKDHRRPNAVAKVFQHTRGTPVALAWRPVPSLEHWAGDVTTKCCFHFSL